LGFFGTPLDAITTRFGGDDGRGSVGVLPAALVAVEQTSKQMTAFKQTFQQR